MKKRGISLIVLIVTIIVIIVLAAVVILTISKNNPIESAKEARFKEDLRAVQDEIAMYIAKQYQKDTNEFSKEKIEFNGQQLINNFGMPTSYKDKIAVEKGNVVYIGEDEKEIEWSNSLGIKNILNPVPYEWRKYIGDMTEEGVPIPIGFSYKEGNLETGVVIEDSLHNEFVWVSATEQTYLKDKNFRSYVSSGTIDSLPYGITDDKADVIEYGGFYIGRYEATTSDGTENTMIDEERVPTCQKGKTVWTNISYSNAKKSAEKMYSGDNLSVQSGLATGIDWDTTCHYLEEDIKKINESASLVESKYYGNYQNSDSPANVSGYGSKKESGFTKYWSVKNIYDLAGNVWEWTNEKTNSFYIFRGGSYKNDVHGLYQPISCRHGDNSDNSVYDLLGFRIRLYIKTNS